jgi:alkylation response protein AidB-like acyl-CoA dehydrogenase
MAAIPVPAFENLFAEDPTGAKYWRHWIGPERFEKFRAHFQALGDAGAKAAPLSARADRQGPVLRTHDLTGARAETVDFHPDYHDLEQLAYGRGIIALKYDPDFLRDHRDVRHLVGFGSGYYFAQTELGLYCPICMTDGVGRVLERHAGTHPAALEALSHLASRNLEELWQGAMFLTEKQGGSDVGANEATARQEGSRWLLDGDKWFCSNVTADAILALARMPDGPPGTKGLGLFLVLRNLPEGNGSSIRIHRLKDKLGVGSMPTGETTFERTEGFLIGGIGEGFKQMAEMLNLSRLYNAVASVAGMRRALLEAYAYGCERQAFGRPLVELPLWRAAMADLAAELLGMFALVFDTVRTLDRADCGDDLARRLVRITIPIAKALSGKLAVFAVSECMEAIGGNAYIEESILPRLLRDVQVLPIWEGTTHILTLDALRAIEKERSHEALFARIAEALQRAEIQGPSEPVEEVRRRLGQNRQELERLFGLAPSDQELEARQWLESTGRTLTLALLLEASATAPALTEVTLAAFRRLRVRPWSVMPVCQGGAAALKDTEAALLESIRAPRGAA